MSPAAFARLIGTTRQAVSRYLHGERMPEVRLLQAIKEATRGAVTANDFAAHVHDVVAARPTGLVKKTGVRT